MGDTNIYFPSFKAADGDDDGSSTLEEFKKAIDKLYREMNIGKQLFEGEKYDLYITQIVAQFCPIFDKIDLNSDRKISEEEYKLLYEATQGSAKPFSKDLAFDTPLANFNKYANAHQKPASTLCRLPGK